jgi:hypothetical protein
LVTVNDDRCTIGLPSALAPAGTLPAGALSTYKGTKNTKRLSSTVGDGRADWLHVSRKDAKAQRRVLLLLGAAGAVSGHDWRFAPKCSLCAFASLRETPETSNAQPIVVSLSVLVVQILT